MAMGIGFSAGSTKWIPTLGFSIGAAIIPPDVRWFDTQKGRLLGTMDLVNVPFISRRY